MDTIAEIHHYALSHFEYHTDASQYGHLDYWLTRSEIDSQISRNGVFRGDCEDFATLVLGLLRDNGYKARLVLCIRPDGVWHIVTEVDGMVLDNTWPEPVARDALPYEWVSISGYAGEKWRAIE